MKPLEMITLTEVAKKLSPVMKGMFQWLSEWNPDE